MRLVFLDKATLGGGLDFQAFEEFGGVEYWDISQESEVKSRLAEAEVVIINKIRITQDLLTSLPKLRLICLTATGFDNVDIKACRQAGVAVCNVRGYSTPSVAQHTIALALALIEPLEYWDQFVKSGAYSGSGAFTHWGRTFGEVKGKTWGIFGMGAIGAEVAKVAEALGAKVIYYSTQGIDRQPTYDRLEWEDFLSESDILSIHAPLNQHTSGRFGQSAFQKMKPHAVLLNLGRGGIVNIPELVWALETGQIAKAALDVFPQEPLDKNSPLLRADVQEKLLLTPHVAWGSDEARQRCLDEIIANIRAFLQGEERNRVDLVKV